MKIYDVVILGAGASGLMCAGNLSRKLSVAIIESNEKIGKKLKISGGGKCNITNVSVSAHNYEGESALVSYALKKFSKDNLLRFLDRNRVPLELRKERYYFCEHSSDEIINALEQNAKYAEVLLNHKIVSVTKKEEVFEIKTDKGVLNAMKVVVATGGESFKTLGASSIGLEIAKSFHIEVKDFQPALVGLTLQKEQFWMRELSGLSCYVHIKVEDKTLKEEMLFAHKGISGPAVLSASLYWKRGDISIDFLPEQNILELVMGSRKLVSSVMHLPKRLAKALLNAIDMQDVECNKLTKLQREKLKQLHNYSFSPSGNFGFTKAEVSRGGVVSEALQKESMESKDVSGLYFIGEVVDVTGELGGYNFQWAFSSAIVCANSLKKQSVK